MKDADVLILRPTPWKWALGLAFCLVGNVIGVFMVQNGGIIGWLVGAALFAGSVVAAASLYPGVSFLRLDPKFFTIRSLGVTRYIRGSKWGGSKQLKLPH